MRFTRPRSPAIAICFALLAAAAGAAVGEPAIARAAALITGAEVRDGSLTTRDVQDRSLQRKDFARGHLDPRKRSVGDRQLKRGAVTTRAVRDGTLTPSDFAPGVLPTAGGAPGSPGPQGAPGPEGPPGPGGPQGESGFARVLNIDAEFGPFQLPGFSGNTILVPEPDTCVKYPNACCTPGPCCTTQPYSAEPGDVAVLSLTATGSPTTSVNDVMYVNAMQKVGSGAWSRLNSPATDAAESLHDGTALATTHAVAPLQGGNVYRWAVGVASNNSLTLNPAYCQGTVMIVRTTA